MLSLRKRDVAPLPRKRFVKVTIPLYYEGHAYRAGSRIRVTHQRAATATSRSGRSARAQPKGTATVAIARSKTRPSRLVLPVVAGRGRADGLPPCPGLRGEPCRGRVKNRAAVRIVGGMNAVTFDALDTPPRFRDDLDAPGAGSGQVLVRVRASSANPVDNAIAAGMLAQMVEHDFPVTLGRDYAGVVESVGDGVSEYAAGDEVFGFLTHANPTVHDGALGRADRGRPGPVDRQGAAAASTSPWPAPRRSRPSPRWRASTRSSRARASAC